MARRRKPENESVNDAQVRRTLEQIADTATRGEKVSWDRKMDNMVSLIAKLKPLEDQILDLMSAKLPILDEIAALRKDMVKECVHPYHLLVTAPDGTARCKFCDKKFAPQQKKTK